MKTAIKVENVSKLYNLKDVGVATIGSDLKRFWAKARGKEDPAFKLAETNDRTQSGKSDYVWALKDINFEVKQGEVLGIVGKNGAGKSTLLKILSRVAAPTTGQIKVRGRLASLLEVGTGFHPDLSGRENIFLNGAILGMTKTEIKKKFDEIVEFSGIGRYIDTPVKRYSSGMYIRLAFAVAAHLEPEILIVDEVLAVGDAEFQKKCLGKMKSVSGEGRTILFVSHNLTAIKNLCPTSIFMQNGLITMTGETSKVIDTYLSNEVKHKLRLEWNGQEENPGNNFHKINRFEIIPLAKRESNTISINTPVKLEFEFENLVEGDVNMSLHVYNLEDLCIFGTTSPISNLKKGKATFTCNFPERFFNDDTYSFSMVIARNKGGEGTMVLQDRLSVEFTEDRDISVWHSKWPGVIRPYFNWDISQ